MNDPHIVVLGGGPAGCAAAFQLRRKGKGRVTLLERQDVVGGNAGSFFANGQHLDYGSHRLHAACDPEILRDIREMLGDDLAHQVRHGRIRLRDRFLHFPIKTVDLLLRLDKRFALGMGLDMATRALPFKSDEGTTFASVLRANLGKTMCEGFYFPYSRKLWGFEPEQLSGIQAQKRVSAGSFVKLLKRLISPPGEGKFYYPRRGYGQLSEIYAEAATKSGADIRLGWNVDSVTREDGKWLIDASCDGSSERIEADHVWSTIPLTVLIRMMEPKAPAEVFRATQSIEFRAMVLGYLELDVDQFTPTDAHYFPEANVRMTRLSEPKNYFGTSQPAGRTTLCAELPCKQGDELWSMSDEDIGRLVVDDMARAGLPLARPPLSFSTRRLPQAYPIYTNGYEDHLTLMDSWLASLPNFLVYGRQGLFAHDNTHHAFYMAYCAVECLEGPHFNDRKWQEYREIFATHVVED